MSHLWLLPVFNKCTLVTKNVMWMCVCLCDNVCAWISLYIYIYTERERDIYTYIYIIIYIYIYIYKIIYAYTWVYQCLGTFVCIYMCVFLSATMHMPWCAVGLNSRWLCSHNPSVWGFFFYLSLHPPPYPPLSLSLLLFSCLLPPLPPPSIAFLTISVCTCLPSPHFPTRVPSLPQLMPSYTTG